MPLHYTFQVSRDAKLTESAYDPSFSHPRMRCGVEDIWLEHTGGTGDNMIKFENCDQCWIKNIVSTNVTHNCHVQTYYSYRCEVRDSTFWGSQYYGAGGGYGVALYYDSTGFLVENNIFRHLHVSMQCNYGSSGNVFAYNFEGDGFSDSSGVPSGQGQSIGMSFHGSVAYQNLVEGNYCENKMMGDFTHGSGGYMNTIF